MKPRSQADHDVVVIGAGQTGLAAGHHLARRGIEFVILEADERVGDVWRRRYDSLLLYSPAKYNALPGLPFPLLGHTFPTGRQMADYLEAYAAHHDLPVPHRRAGRTTGASRWRRRWLRAHRWRCALPGAPGDRGNRPFQRPFVPEFAAHLHPAIRQVHSSDYRDPAQLADGPVLVVGVSHSGADITYEVAKAGHRTILSGTDRGQLPFSVDSRRMRLAWPLMRFMASRVLTLGTPMGRMMAPKVRAHGGPLLRIRRTDLEHAGVRRHPGRTAGVQDGHRFWPMARSPTSQM